MANRSIAYWEGVATGVVVGIAAAAFLPRLFSNRESARPDRRSAHDILQAVNDAPEETKGHPFASRRDAPESAGDPAIISGPAGRSGVEFRMSGAPGPRSEAEQLMMPGRPGQHMDSGEPVRVSTRTVDLGAAGSSGESNAAD